MRIRGYAAVTLAATVCAGPAAGQPAEVGVADFDQPGLELVLRSPGSDATDARVARLGALYVPEGEPPSPFLEAGPFAATFRGAIELDLNDSFRFVVRGNGGIRLSIAGEVVLEYDTLPNDAPASTDGEVWLRKGLNPVELRYRSPAHGDASVRLTWSNDYLPEEAVPPASLRHADSPALDRGRSRRATRNLVADAMCIRCHPATEGTDAGTTSMPEATALGPDLDGIGARVRRRWIEQWLLDPRSLRPWARMPKILSTEVAEARRQAAYIAAYLAGGLGNDPALEPATATPAAEVAAGRRLYREIGCAACHGDATSPPSIEEAPRLIRSVEPGADTESNDQPLRLRDRWQPAALAAYLLDPTRFDPWSRMPRTRLEAVEASSLAAYLLTAAPPNGAAAALRGSLEGDPDRGRRLAEELRCRSCHTLPGGDPPPAASPLRQLTGAAPAWTEAAAATSRHPVYDQDPTEVDAVWRLLAENEESFSRAVPVEYADRRVGASGCLACHSRDGVLASWSPPPAAATVPAAESAADDLFAPPTDTEDGTGPDHLPPDLTWAGEKLRSDWLEGHVAGRVEDRPRPHLRVRMPAFPGHADLLAAGLHHQHGLSPSLPEPDPVDPELAAVGSQLVRSDRLGCHSCHALGEDPALGGEGSEETINFDLVRRRLRRPYFGWFLRDPQRILPGSKMPQFVDEDGFTGLYDVFDGEAESQFEAIWHYLGTLE